MLRLSYLGRLLKGLLPKGDMPVIWFLLLILPITFIILLVGTCGIFLRILFGHLLLLIFKYKYKYEYEYRKKKKIITF